MVSNTCPMVLWPEVLRIKLLCTIQGRDTKTPACSPVQFRGGSSFSPMYLSIALVLVALSSYVGAVPLIGTSRSVRVAISKGSGLCDNNGIVKRTYLQDHIHRALQYVSRCRLWAEYDAVTSQHLLLERFKEGS